jgi:sulfate permease, SulP family
MRMPLATSVRGYQRAWLAADIMAGTTLVVIAIPEQIATSRLAGMPAATALWAFVAATIAFFFFGASRNLSVGADSTIAPLFAAAVTRLSTEGSPHSIALTELTALITGALILIVGVLRLGWIADFLSVPIITGFLAGVAAIITVHQLPDLLGTGAASGSFVHRIHVIVTHLGSTNSWSLGIGAVVFIVMIASEKIDRRIPAALIGLVGSTVLVGAASLAHHGVKVLGSVTSGLPDVGIPSASWGDIVKILPVSVTVAIICLGQTAATVRSFDAENTEAMMNSDFVGLGAGNILSGFFGAFPVDASPARTSIVANARGRTQVTCLVAALIIFAACPAFGQLHLVPLATLAAILLFVATRLVKVKELRSIAHFSRTELGLAVITAVVVAFVGVEQGIGVAVLLAILDRTRISARPRLVELGRVPGTTSWASLKEDKTFARVEGIRVELFSGPLYFANAGEFRDRVKAAILGANPPRALVLDAAGMGDIDYTGATVFRSVIDDLRAAKVELAVARAGPEVIGNLRSSMILQQIGDGNLFDTVDEAVKSLAARIATPTAAATPPKSN